MTSPEIYFLRFLSVNMALNEDSSSAQGAVLAGRGRWAAGIGVAVLGVALVGLWIGSSLRGTGVAPVLAIGIAVGGGAAIALRLVEE